jgi:hypothetical protein
MSTSTPQPPSSTPVLDATAQAKLIHNVALGALIVCPIVILLPPRKLDIYTLALVGGTFFGANQLTYESTGTSIVSRQKRWMESMSPGQELPPKALEMQARLKAEKEYRLRQSEGLLVKGKEEREGKVLQELARRKEEDRVQEGRERGLVEKIWMGSEGDDWKAKRAQTEKEALAEGRGYGGLIMDQIWEVWNWGQVKAEEVKEIDEKVVQERKEEKANGKK